MTWAETHSVSVESEDDLVEELSRLQVRFESRPAIVDLTLADGQTLSVGLGREWSVLSLMPDREPPYYASVGDNRASGSIWFDYFGSPSEFPMTQAVRGEVAIDAMRRFLATGGRPTNVLWQTT